MRDAFQSLSKDVWHSQKWLGQFEFLFCTHEHILATEVMVLTFIFTLIYKIYRYFECESHLLYEFRVGLFQRVDSALKTMDCGARRTNTHKQRNYNQPLFIWNLMEFIVQTFIGICDCTSCGTITAEGLKL